MSFEIKITNEPKLDRPVLIEGLPGIGYVGKIAARHLIVELRAKKFAILHSDLFPPQVLVRRSGLIETMKNEFYYWEAEESDQKDLIIVDGNTQSSTSEGQYLLSKKILEVVESQNISRVYTLGGLGVGRTVEKPKVFGAVTDKDLIPKLEELNVIVKREGLGQIVGVSGLLLGLAKVRGIPGTCLMGETSGFYLDSNAARIVLEVLTRLLNIEVDLTRLVKKAKEAEKRVAEAQRMERKIMEEMGMIQRRPPSDEEMRYIG
jgi:hypothetical protein